MKRILLLASIALTLGATSCKNSIHDAMDISGKWIVSSINGETVPKTMETVTITFDKKTNSYQGVTGVNLINGSYQLDDNELTIEDGAMTRKMGDPVSNDVETKYINAIHATTSVTMEKGNLLLKDNTGKTVMKLKK